MQCHQGIYTATFGGGPKGPSANNVEKRFLQCNAPDETRCACVDLGPRNKCRPSKVSSSPPRLPRMYIQNSHRVHSPYHVQCTHQGKLYVLYMHSISNALSRASRCQLFAPCHFQNYAGNHNRMDCGYGMSLRTHSTYKAVSLFHCETHTVICLTPFILDVPDKNTSGWKRFSSSLNKSVMATFAGEKSAQDSLFSLCVVYIVCICLVFC